MSQYLDLEPPSGDYKISESVTSDGETVYLASRIEYELELIPEPAPPQGVSGVYEYTCDVPHG